MKPMMRWIFLLAFALGACSHNARTSTIQTAFASVNAASKAFVFYDLQHQQEIVSQGADRTSVETALADWRTKRRTVELVFDSAYRAIATAATFNDDPSLQGMLNAVAILSQELAQLGVKIP